jgi:hypothetical protein
MGGKNRTITVSRIGAGTMEQFPQNTSRRLRPRERVIWWKRVPGGASVYPVRAIVLMTTAKRVKIQAEDDSCAVQRSHVSGLTMPIAVC